MMGDNHVDSPVSTIIISIVYIVIIINHDDTDTIDGDNHVDSPVRAGTSMADRAALHSLALLWERHYHRRDHHYEQHHHHQHQHQHHHNN